MKNLFNVKLSNSYTFYLNYTLLMHTTTQANIFALTTALYITSSEAGLPTLAKILFAAR